jgi:hypothetical protein
VKRVQALWESYLAEVIPAKAPNIQIVECQRAFYAGAQGLLSAITTGLTPGLEAEQEDLAMMDGIAAELKAFAVNVAVEAKAEDVVERLDDPVRLSPRRLEVEAMGRATIKRAIEGLPRGIIVTLFLTTAGKDGFLTYLSNGDRQDMIRALVEWLGRISREGNGADVRAALDELRRG